MATPRACRSTAISPQPRPSPRHRRPPVLAVLATRAHGRPAAVDWSRGRGLGLSGVIRWEARRSPRRASRASPRGARALRTPPILQETATGHPPRPSRVRRMPRRPTRAVGGRATRPTTCGRYTYRPTIAGRRRAPSRRAVHSSEQGQNKGHRRSERGRAQFLEEGLSSYRRTAWQWEISVVHATCAFGWAEPEGAARLSACGCTRRVTVGIHCRGTRALLPRRRVSSHHWYRCMMCEQRECGDPACRLAYNVCVRPKPKSCRMK